MDKHRLTTLFLDATPEMLEWFLLQWGSPTPRNGASPFHSGFRCLLKHFMCLTDGFPIFKINKLQKTMASCPATICPSPPNLCSKLLISFQRNIIEMMCVHRSSYSLFPSTALKYKICLQPSYNLAGKDNSPKDGGKAQWKEPGDGVKGKL